METLLIIEDSLPYLNDLEVLLKDQYRILKAINGKTGMEILRKENISAILLDLNLPDTHGFKLLKKIRIEKNTIPVIIITESNDIETAVKAIKEGAYDYFPKISNIDLLTNKISNALETIRLSQTMNVLRESIDESFNDFVYECDSMAKIDLEISRIAKQNVDVLLLGETGVGKDLIAYQIHKRSERAEKPFVSVPIRNLNDQLMESELFGHEKWAFTGANETKIGKFEGANGGTLYLPEISDLTKNIQIKLLEFFQYKRIERVGSGANSKIKLDVRVILASNRNLELLMKQGQLREDFFYRINFSSIYIPPLRERKEDIIPISVYLVNKHSRLIKGNSIKLPDDTLNYLLRQEWKGNVRELEHSIIGAISRCETDTLSINDFKLNHLFHSNDELQPESLPDFKSAEKGFKYQFFSDLLNECNNNISKAAEKAGISRQQLHKIIKELGL